MGILQSIKGALIEEIPDENEEISASFQESSTIQEEGPAIDVELDAVKTDTLVSDIYEQNGLQDLSSSIFKVEALINSLPKEMVTETKRASVLQILDNFNLTESEVSDDGAKRIAVLDGVKRKITQDCNELISNKQQEIEEAKKLIATLESQIAAEQEESKSANEIITAESDRILSLINFIGGTAK